MYTSRRLFDDTPADPLADEDYPLSPYEEVLQAQEPVLVDFSAVWCPPSRVLEPVVEELAGEYAGRVKVAKLDADQYQETVLRYQIRGLPTLLFFKDGQVQDTVVGAAPKGQLVQKLDAVLQAS